MNLFRRTHGAVIRLGFGTFALLLLFPVFASAQSRVEWEVVNPFPFIRARDSVDALRKVYASINDKSALGLERALQRADEARIDKRRTVDMQACVANGESESNCVKKHWYPYLGWFADIARNDHAKTCWDSSALKFRTSGECSNYFDPKSHRVRAWIEDSTESAADLRWFANDVEIMHPQLCGPEYRKGACIELDVPYSADPNAPGVPIRVVADDGTIRGNTEKPVKVVDLLIAGLGDSFGSGEGNPDIPAQFMTNESDRDFFYFWKWRRFPRKDKVDPASTSLRRPDVAWLDRRCHRSMYSYQFKAALRYALEHPQRSVTYVSFACSGATTANIFQPKAEQKAQEAMPPDSKYYLDGGRGKIELQLSALKHAIGDRPIDLLLLSSGGNDIGFSSYVAYVVTSGKTRWLIGKPPKTERIAREIKQIGENYRELQRAIFDPIVGVRIKDCGGSRTCDRIVLSPYPNVFTNEDNRICKVVRNEFTVPFNRDLGRERRAESLFNELFLPLGEFQLRIPTTHGWSIATSTRDAWQRHGFCAQDSLSQTNLEERFIMPQRRQWVWGAHRPGKDNVERDLGPYEPWKYNAYASRSRWIRLPIDSKLTADQQRRIWKFSFDFLFEDDRSSVMHPTAEGHANNADANYDVMRRLLN